MAFLYKYQIHYKKIRERINLSHYENEITKAIRTIFKNNLKYSIVTKRRFELRLYEVPKQIDIIKLTKEILSNSWDLRFEIDDLERKFYKKSRKRYFSKMQNTFVAMVEWLPDDNYTIEMVNYEDFESGDYYKDMKRKIKDELILKSEDKHKFDHYFRVFMDTYELNGVRNYDINDMHKEFIKNSDSNQNKLLFLKIKGKFKNSKCDNKITSIVDYNNRNNNYGNQMKFDLTNHSIQEKYNNEAYFKIITVSDMQDEVVLENIRNRGLSNDIKEFDGLLSEDLSSLENLIVYDTGQSSMNAFFKEGEIKLFFDYGCSKKEFELDEYSISNDVVIILSHIHTDHWNGLNSIKDTLNDAFNYKWIIPNQNLKINFSKRVAEIINQGGVVMQIASENYYELNINENLVFYLSRFSNRDGINRTCKNVHESGIYGIYKKNIDDTEYITLLSGDQRYEYMNFRDIDINNIDVLVSTHHGGSYSRSKRNAVINEIPNGSDGLITIFSCGQDNRFSHPTTVSDYERRGWERFHNTNEDGDFNLNSFLGSE